MRISDWSSDVCSSDLKNLTIHEAYAFALTSEPLLDKQEEENGYSIQKDVAKIWRRETGIKPSGTLTADDILSAHQTDDARNKTSTLSAPADKIGRASCRERVCQYV